MSELTDRQSISTLPATAGEVTLRRDRLLMAYVAVALALLAPGLAAAWKLGPVGVEPVAGWLAALDREMQTIAFGATPRFWMGVAGATMMALLLLYPLRKIFGIGRWISIAAWFHLHVVLGLAGPVLILYHCYFGTGSTPANVALFTTLAVVLSGIFGHFVYARLSADFHGLRKLARDHLAQARIEIAALPATTTRSKLLEDLDAYESRVRAERRAFGLGGPQRELRRDLIRRAHEAIVRHAEAEGWTAERTRQAVQRARQSLNSYFAGLARAGRRAIWERIAGTWRLLHLPLFYVTVIATSIHVYKVWNMDAAPAPAVMEAQEGTAGGAGENGAQAKVAGAADTLGASSSVDADGRAQPKPATIATRRVHTVPETLGRSDNRAADKPAQVATAPAAEPVPKLVAPKTMLREGQDKPDAGRQQQVLAPAAKGGAAAYGSPPPAGDASAAPALIEPERKAEQPEPPPPSVSTAKPKAPPPTIAAGPTPPVASPPVTATAAPPPRMAAAPASGAPVPPPPMAAGARGADPAVEQLARKTAKWDNTGKLDPATVLERLAVLKADPSFDHGKTRFPLTGKHKRLTCESCHETTLKDTPRRCIDCHKKDDVHRGRRPNCENCHVTTNWGTIRRR